jgi:hypothetical protein
MCGASHIQLAAAGTRLSLPIPFDARRTRSQGKCVSRMCGFKDVALAEQALRLKLASNLRLRGPVDPDQVSSGLDSWR